MDFQAERIDMAPIVFYHPSVIIQFMLCPKEKAAVILIGSETSGNRDLHMDKRRPRVTVGNGMYSFPRQVLGDGDNLPSRARPEIFI